MIYGPDRKYMLMAAVKAAESTDRSRKVGCVLVAKQGVIASCNSPIFGVDANNDELHERPARYLWTEHAERNAIYRAARRGVSLLGSTAYVTWFPCMDCARALVQSGVYRLVAHAPDFDDPKWGDEFRSAIKLLEAGLVNVDLYDERPA